VILKVLKVLCFHIVLQVFILDGLRVVVRYEMVTRNSPHSRLGTTLLFGAIAGRRAHFSTGVIIQSSG